MALKIIIVHVFTWNYIQFKLFICAISLVKSDLQKEDKLILYDTILDWTCIKRNKEINVTSWNFKW